MPQLDPPGAIFLHTHTTNVWDTNTHNEHYFVNNAVFRVLFNSHHLPCLNLVVPHIIRSKHSDVQPLQWLSMILPNWKNKRQQSEEVLRLIKSSNQDYFVDCGRKKCLWRKEVILFEFGSSFLLVQPALQQVTFRTSNKTDRRYGNAFERKWLHFQLPRSCVQQILKKSISAWWVEQVFCKSLLQTVNTRSGRAHYLTVWEALCSQTAEEPSNSFCRYSPHLSKHPEHPPRKLFLFLSLPCRLLRYSSNVWLYKSKEVFGRKYFYSARCLRCYTYLSVSH